MSSDEPPSYSSDNGSGAEESPPGLYSPTPGICGQCQESVGEISWKLGDQPSRISHNFYSRVEQTTTPDTLITPLTHLLVQPCPIHLLEVPPGPGNKQGRGHTDRQSDRQKEKKGEEGQLLCGTVPLLCMVKL